MMITSRVAARTGTTPLTGALQGLHLLDVSDLPRWKSALERARCSGYGCYFPYALAHQHPGRTVMLVGEDAGCLCVFILKDREGGRRLDLFLPPLPMDVAVARRCLERANDFNGDRSARILRIDADVAPMVASIRGLSVRERRSQYLYAPRAYGGLSGAKFRTLRYKVSRVRRMRELEVIPYHERHAGACRTLLEQWADRHRRTYGTSGDAPLSRRSLALADAFGPPDLIGELILLGGRVVAFAFGGEIRPGVGCLFESKTDVDIRGLPHYQYYSFLKKLEGFETVNGGSDARRPGIAQFKETLRPVAMHLEYRGSQLAT